jgi:N-acetylated-alpha-linked acidic dipeptidase
VNLADFAMHHATDRRTDFQLGPPGAGSDYVAFLDYLGIASLNSSFAGVTKSGVYHSAYDSLYWYLHFGDSDFVYGRALSQFTLTALLRLSNCAVLPFEFSHVAATTTRYLDSIDKTVNVNPLRAQLKTLRQRADRFNGLLEAAMKKGPLPIAQQTKLNGILIQTERALLAPRGLPNRPWYKHQLYAPGFYSGYAAKTLPGIREAAENKDWALAAKQAAILTSCFAALNRSMDQAIELTNMKPAQVNGGLN